MALPGIQALTFDCYGTLVDWETGLLARLRPWAREHGLPLADELLLEAFAEVESASEHEYPTWLYRDILAEVHRRLARRFGVPVADQEAIDFGSSVGDWPVFEDTPAALRRLQRHYKLVVVSNVDRASFARTHAKLGVELDGLVTAEDAGAYKPDPRPFELAFETLSAWGIERGAILHVAQSLYHDHVPAKALGLRTAWVDRRHGRTGAGATRRPSEDVQPDLVAGSLAALADAISPGG